MKKYDPMTEKQYCTIAPYRELYRRCNDGIKSVVFLTNSIEKSLDKYTELFKIYINNGLIEIVDNEDAENIDFIF